ncbi:DNA polymerase [Polar bear adenovirus 1]|uniref:DNA polymerase n=1 Tax=Polar bear adenovirus 1 TaxID=2250215 RepID=A0A2Z4QJF1_9ADEN|nr:DNA polymerase [Polar bear adenovirus 1]
MADSLARQQDWEPWQASPNTFYLLNPNKTFIGHRFKVYRRRLQETLVSELQSIFLSNNPHLRELCAHKRIDCLDDLTFKDLTGVQLKGEPSFTEVYVIGHNINGFDEIVLAAQVINSKSETPPLFKVFRNFLPRNGKILFNDITFALPNPAFRKKSEGFETWEEGICQSADLKFQYVKFMVRDTFALTHTSLRNAAKAYELPIQKGYCPYKAVNDFYMVGSYRKDKDGFPASDYWDSLEDYHANKTLWIEKNENAYDIIQTTLEYCANDVIVTSALVQKLQDSYQSFISETAGLRLCTFNIFQRPTISSNSHAIFKQLLYRREKPKRGNLSDLILAPSHHMYDYVRSSIRGGRCYPTFIGILEKPIYVFDICGMYASALTHPLPTGRPLNPFDRALAIDGWLRKLDNRAKIDYFDTSLCPGIFTIDADAPDDEFLDPLPPFCSRKGGRLCWTNENLRGEVATSIDVITLHNRGWKIRILEDDRTTVFPQWKCLAKNYVQLNIEAKEKADKEHNQTLRSIAKLLSNALYGSFATKLDNKTTIFSDQLENEFRNEILQGKYIIKSSSFIETENLSAEILPEFVVAYSPAADSSPSRKQATTNEDPWPTGPLNTPGGGHVTYTYKPITFLDFEDTDMCLQTLEKNSALIDNNRYPSHIASFVLAWTRAFMSEWADFLYEEDRGKPWEIRQLKSVYGDTDSLFTTELGKKLMEEKGKRRLKKFGAKMIFDENNPDLTWAVECETLCSLCHSEAHSPESVFLAPKLYGLKHLVCDHCAFIGPGKLRAKGHATDHLTYDDLTSCYLNDIQGGTQRFFSKRMSIKRTLVSHQAHVQPFTVTETTLIRKLRPWKDKTLHEVDQNHLIPYSNRNPNPRNEEVCLINLPWDM